MIIDKVLENYLAQRIEERRGSIHSINQSPNPLPRPGLGSRSSSACSGAFPSTTLTHHPSSTSLLPPDHTYGSTYQSMHSVHSGQSAQWSNTHDPRVHTPHIQERSISHDGYHQQTQPRRKASTPVLSRERDSPSLTTISSKEGRPLRIKTAGVAVPARKGDRHKFPASPSEHEFMAGISQSIDSVASSRHDKSTAKYLPGGGLLSSSPSHHPTQGSEYAFQTLKLPVSASSPINNTAAGSIFSGDTEQSTHATGVHAQLPPLPPLSSSVSSSSAITASGPRQKKHGTHDSIDGLPLAPTKHRDSYSRD